MKKHAARMMGFLLSFALGILFAVIASLKCDPQIQVLFEIVVVIFGAICYGFTHMLETIE